jgi:putative transposase
MAKINLHPGVRYQLAGVAYEIRAELPNNTYQVHNFGIHKDLTITYEEIVEKLYKNELLFETSGKHSTYLHPGDVIKTNLEFVDFGMLPEKDRDLAWRRYEIIKPLLNLMPGERTVEYLSKYSQEIFERMIQTLPEEERQKIRDKRAKNHAMPREYACSVRSIQGWLADFIKTGGEIRSLVDQTKKKGGKGKSRLKNARVDNILQDILENYYLRPERPTVEDTYKHLANKISEANMNSLSGKLLEIPSIATVYRRIKTIDPYRKVKSRHGEKAAKRIFGPVFPGPEAKFPGEIIEIDHSLLDIFVVDMEHRLPIGRPSLTLAVDKRTRCFWGINVGFEPFSFLTDMGCILHGIMPKNFVKEVFKTKNDWLPFGIPGKIITDNGPDFKSPHFMSACMDLGITLEYLPKETPWWKPEVERLFGSVEKGLVHLMPGTSFSNIFEKDEYESMKNAVVSLEVLIEQLYVWIVDYYMINWHTGIEDYPAKRWEREVNMGALPALPANKEDLAILLGRTESRALEPYGIDFDTIRYQSDLLMPLRMALYKEKKASERVIRKVTFKYDPSDLRMIHVFDPFTQHYIEVPANDQEYTTGLSIWSHRVIRRYTNQRKKEGADFKTQCEAKKRLQELTEREFLHPKNYSTRKHSTRLLYALAGNSLPFDDLETEVKENGVISPRITFTEISPDKSDGTDTSQNWKTKDLQVEREPNSQGGGVRKKDKPHQNHSNERPQNDKKSEGSESEASKPINPPIKIDRSSWGVAFRGEGKRLMKRVTRDDENSSGDV